MLSRVINRAWLLNTIMVVTVICSSCATTEKSTDTVNPPLFVQLNIESGRIDGVTQGREFENIQLGNGIKGVVSLVPQGINVIEGVTTQGQSFRCCGWYWWFNCAAMSEVVAAYKFDPTHRTYEFDYLGTPDGDGGVNRLEQVEYDPTDTLKDVKVLNVNVGMLESDTGSDTFVIDGEGSVWR